MNKFSALFFISLTVVGEGLLLHRFSGNSADDIIGIAAALVLFTALVLWGRKIPLPKSRASGLIIGAVSAGLGVFSVVLWADYAADVMLEGVWVALPFSLMLGSALLLALKNKKALFKAALVLLPLVLVFTLLILGLSLPYMEIKYIIPYKSPTLSGCAAAMGRSLLGLAGAVVPLYYVGKRTSAGVMIAGITTGGGILISGFLATLGIFGSEYASTLTHPLASAVEAAAVGDIFSRCDPLLYCIAFFSCLIRTAACLAALRAQGNSK